ncbi:S-layer homology domain-containing protein [Heliorestis convoluta]|uniref:S-layer family protein n=1 Tax=Heliorestis convoluta TaxID=356322 RepID=A0A5Q2MXZ5_9FIRM|nr:S-layer homology domain-containing protein [Heliorestis convoluta]QGG46189.1 S-layer family protein [Heliorestis convoluta]
MRKRIISTVLALSLIATPLSALAAPIQFQDVTTNSMEYRHISKLSSLGVIKGRGDGTFGSRDPVKHLEALVMVMRFFDLESTAAGASHRLTPTMEASFGGNVPDWGKGFLVTAADYNFLAAQERFNWEQGASRAWVAKLLVRMLGQDYEAQLMSNRSLSFTDANQVRAADRGYIALATDLGLIRGYTDGSFQPNRIVSRAEMAIFLDRAEKKMASLPPGISVATVIQAQNNSLSVLNEQGGLTALALDNRARIFVGDRQVSATDLKAQDQIRYIQSDNKVVYIEVTQEGNTSTIPHRGEIVHHNTENGLLSIRFEDGKGMQTYPLASNVSIINLQGQDLAVSQLAIGSKVQIGLNPDNRIASILVEAQSFQGSEGTIVELDLTKQLLILSDATGRFLTFTIDEKTDLHYAGRRFATLDDLRKGDLVSVDVDSQQRANSITLLQVQNQGLIQGTVTLVSRDNRIVTVRSTDGQLHAFEMPRNVPIQFNDGTIASFDDIHGNDTVTVTMQNSTVEKVVVHKTSETKGIWGKVVSIVFANKDNGSTIDRDMLIVTDREGNLRSYDIKNNVVLDFDTVNPRLSDLAMNMAIEFELDNGEVSYITMSLAEGTVTRIDSDRNILSVKDEKGSVSSYIVSKDVQVELMHRSRAKLDDVEVDDLIRYRLNDKEEIDRIYVFSSLFGEVTDIDSTRNRIFVRDMDDYSRTYTVSNKLTLKIDGISNPRVSQVERFQWVMVNYWGDTPGEIFVQPPVVGEVLSVESNRSRLTVRHYDGTSRTYNIDSDFQVDKAGVTSNRLSNVEVGDRVRLVLDDEARVHRAIVARMVSGQVDGIHRTLQEVYLQGNNIIGYLVEPDTYVLEKGVRRAFEDIRHHQNVTIYYIRGYKALEVIVH